jgi:outer membrane protein TolC
MNDPDYPVADATVLLARQTPLDKPVRFDLDELVNTALEHRYELGQQQLKVDASTITLDAAKNNLLPKLDFKGSIDPMGLTHDGFDAALSDQMDFNRLSYSAGLQFEVPLGNREAEAIYRRTQLQRNQNVVQYHSLVEQTTADVKIKFRDVETTWYELRYYRLARLQQERALRTLEDQLKAGNEITPFTVRNKLDTELRLADARLQESTALSNYNIAIANLERSKGTLLKYNNITLEEEGTGALKK